ncbi:MAG: hypothetical protein O3B21_13230 [Proteobacteria bacterium]|nr:hypothetical protein [Pseudomonadota bacterium]MDA1356409.1 hypothetical protein [Pseudomonadota bacterium]
MDPKPSAFDPECAGLPQTLLLSGAGAAIGGRYEVQFAERLNHLDSPQADAYGVHDLEGGRRRHFALILQSNGYGRFAQFENFAAVDSDGMLRAVAQGAVTVTGAAHQQMVLILERPAGGKLMVRDGVLADRLDERAIIDRILSPLEDGLRALHRAGLAHRAIRPDNLYFRAQADGPAVLGECLSAPPGLDQPDAFEPIESALASPAGRGDGTAASDMFALGVTVVTLLSGRWPDQDNTTERLLQRIERGSYRAFAGHLRCSQDMEDLLAGLLYDGPPGRWTVDQLRACMSSNARTMTLRAQFWRLKTVSMIWLISLAFRSSTVTARCAIWRVGSAPTWSPPSQDITAVLVARALRSNSPPS